LAAAVNAMHRWLCSRDREVNAGARAVVRAFLEAQVGRWRQTAINDTTSAAAGPAGPVAAGGGRDLDRPRAGRGGGGDDPRGGAVDMSERLTISAEAVEAIAMELYGPERGTWDLAEEETRNRFRADARRVAAVAAPIILQDNQPPISEDAVTLVASEINCPDRAARILVAEDLVRRLRTIILRDAVRGLTMTETEYEQFLENIPAHTKLMNGEPFDWLPMVRAALLAAFTRDGGAGKTK